jgi:hypothetical protein
MEVRVNSKCERCLCGNGQPLEVFGFNLVGFNGNAFHGHDIVGCPLEFELAATIEMELAWFAATEAQAKKPIGGEKPDGTDNSLGFTSFGINVDQTDYHILLTLHGGGQYLAGHGKESRVKGGREAASAPMCVLPLAQLFDDPMTRLVTRPTETTNFQKIEPAHALPGRMCRPLSLRDPPARRD